MHGHKHSHPALHCYSTLQFKEAVRQLTGIQAEDEYDVQFSAPVPAFGPQHGAVQPGGGGCLTFQGIHQLGEFAIFGWAQESFVFSCLGVWGRKKYSLCAV